MVAAEYIGEIPSLAVLRRHCVELRWDGESLVGATLDDPSRHALCELLEHPACACLRDLTLRNVSESALSFVIDALYAEGRFASLRSLVVQNVITGRPSDRGGPSSAADRRA
jgi:hypothetical protein